MGDGSIKKLDYLYDPKTVVAPQIKDVVSSFKEAEDTKFDYQLSDQYIRVDADGDGLTNDIVGFGILTKNYSSFWKAKYEVQPFYYLIRNSESTTEKGLAVYLSNVDSHFEPGSFRESIGEDCDIDGGPCTVETLKASLSNFRIQYVPGTFVPVEGKVVPQVDIRLSSYRNENDQNRKVEVTRLNLNNFSVQDYAK